MTLRHLPLLAISFALSFAIPLLAGCSRASDSADAKRSPKAPPAVSGVVPAGWHVDVEIDGANAPPIDAPRLDATKPDFADEEHRAWRVATLVGAAAARPGAIIAAVGDAGTAVEMRSGTAPNDPTPVLSLNRRGEVVVEVISPDDPFPDFHGKGGRLNRPGDPQPRVAAPTKLRVYVTPAVDGGVVGTGDRGGEGKGGGASATGAAPPLKAVVAGGPAQTWTTQSFDPVPRFTIHADNSDRDAWSLRDIVTKLVGPKARVTAAVDGDGTRAKIDAKQWADATKTPVLRVNRRGMYKIEWVDKDGNMTSDDDVRDVRSIEIAPGA
jgi:hypothetical protein